MNAKEVVAAVKKLVVKPLKWEKNPHNGLDYSTWIEPIGHVHVYHEQNKSGDSYILTTFMEGKTQDAYVGKTFKQVERFLTNLAKKKAISEIKKILTDFK
jgi:hypothetical protein